MLKLHTFDHVKHLIKTRPGIIITNACNLSCGGCYAQCGKFSHDKVWMIPLNQFRENLQYIVDYMYQGTATILNGEEVEINPEGYGIDLIGGEPTIHPDWDEMWKIITTEFKHINFLVSTNGRIKFPDASNVNFHLSYKTKTIGIGFVPTLVAPIDICDDKKESNYWKSAQADCDIWRSLGCVNPIYKNEISICSVASSWSDLLDLNLGWPLIKDKNPFVNLTDSDVKDKASKVCYRCGWSKKIKLPEWQKSESYDLVSKTNLETLEKNSKNKPYKLVYKEGETIKISELMNERKAFVELSLNVKS